jgi:signal peptidase II
MSLKARTLLLLLVVLSCVGCDQSTKYVAQQILPVGEVFHFLGDTVRFGLAENSGAMLGFGGDLPKETRQALFVFGVSLMLIAMLVWLLKSKNINRHELIAWSLMLGGGASNLFDRIFRDGYVVDFMNIGVGSIRTGIFNVADIAIMLGGLLLLFSAFVRKEPPARKNSLDLS